MSDLSERLGHIISKKGISRFEVHKISGVARQTIDGIFKDKIPSFETVCKLAKALNVSVAYFTDEVSKEPNLLLADSNFKKLSQDILELNKEDQNYFLLLIMPGLIQFLEKNTGSKLGEYNGKKLVS